MKRIVTVLLFVFSVTVSFSVKAQWVTIPDANLVSELQFYFPTCMNGNQMDTTCSAILSTKRLNWSSGGIYNLTGIQYFDSLNYLNCGSNYLSSLPILPNSLDTLFCYYNLFTTLPSLPDSLLFLGCYNNQLTSLPTLPTTLKHLDCSANQLTSLPALPNSLRMLGCAENQISILSTLPDSLLYLYCGKNLLTTLPNLPNTIKELVCNNNQLTSLPTLPDSLTKFLCHYNYLVNLPSLPGTITNFWCQHNLLTSLPSLPPNITTLPCWSNQLTTLPILPSSLLYLTCDTNQLTNLPVLPNSIYSIYCNNNQLTGLPDLPDSLQYLYCQNNLLTILPDLPNQLVKISCNNNSLFNLPILPDGLTDLICSNNQLTILPLFPGTLGRLECTNNQLTNLPDFPDGLGILRINDNSGIMCLPILHHFYGTANYFNISNTGINCLPNLIQHSGSILAIDTMPVCNAFNLNGCSVGWNIQGNVELDGDSSCSTLNDGIEIPFVKMNLFDSGGNLLQQFIANWNGDYSFDTQLGIYSVSVDTLNFPFNVLCPVTNNSSGNLTVADSMDSNVDFRLKCKSGFDLCAWNVTSNNWFFPNDSNDIYVIAGELNQIVASSSCNLGLNGQVKIIINGPANYISPIAGALTPVVNGDTLIYTVTDFSLVNVNTDFAFKLLTDSTALAGNQICFDVTVTPIIGDINISNNTLSYCFSVSNSYDPNEKEVSPAGSLVYPFNDWLTYTINFQNTGTAAAQHIQVLDTLDTDLDASTFQLLSYSHAPMVQLFGSKVHFNFVNINLPDSASNFEGSKGYVSYRVKPLANLPLGTTIENTASIYFDFNSPVVTNTVSNLICNPIAPTAISQTICTGEAYNFNGSTITTAGNYSVTLNAINGCDSVVNLNLTVLNPIASGVSQTICAGDIFIFNGVNLNAAGVYTDTLNAINTCDSVVTLTLTVETINTTVTQASDTLTASTTGTFQWLDCNTQQIVAGATTNVFVPTLTGNYAAIITEGNCSDTSVCMQVFTSVNEVSVNSNHWSVYPNPADENITVTLTQPCENCKIEITNTFGQIVFEHSMNLQSVICNLQSLPSGVYFIALRSDKMSAVKKLVLAESCGKQ